MSLEQIMEKARQAADEKKQKEAQEQQSLDEIVQKARGTAATNKTEKIYAGREDQVQLEQERQQTESQIAEQKQQTEERKKQFAEQKQKDLTELRKILEGLGLIVKEIDDVPAAEQAIRELGLGEEEEANLLGEVAQQKDTLTQQKEETEVQAQATEARVAESSTQEEQITAESAQREQELQTANTERLDQINITNKEAAEILGYDGTHKILEYIQNDRKADELLKDPKYKKIGNSLVQTGANNKKGNEDYVQKLINNYIQDLQEAIKYPKVVKAIAQATEGYDHNASYDGRHLPFRNAQGKETTLSDELWKIEGRDNFFKSLSPEQQKVIEEAIANPSKPITEVIQELGSKYDPEALSKIQESALEENAEFDRTKQISTLENNEKYYENQVRDGQKELEIYDLAEEYGNLQTEISNQKSLPRKKETQEQTLRDLEQALKTVESSKTLLGKVKDKDKQAQLVERIREQKGKIEDTEKQIVQDVSALEKRQAELKTRLLSELEENRPYDTGWDKANKPPIEDMTKYFEHYMNNRNRNHGYEDRHIAEANERLLEIQTKLESLRKPQE